MNKILPCFGKPEPGKILIRGRMRRYSRTEIEEAIEVGGSPEGNTRDNTGEKGIGGYKSRLVAKGGMPETIQEGKRKGGYKSRL